MQPTYYSPPPIDEGLLVATIIDQNGHRKNEEYRKQTYDMVWSYKTWWMLLRTFPEENILCTKPIWVVRQIHRNMGRADFARSFVQYLGRVPQKDELLGDPEVQDEHNGILKTNMLLNELFDYPGVGWTPILEKAKEIKKAKIVSLW